MSLEMAQVLVCVGIFYFFACFIDHLVEMLQKVSTQLESFMSIAQMMLDELYPKC